MRRYVELLEILEREYAETHKKSKDLYNEACKYMPGGDTRTATYFKPFPHFIVKGEGAYIYDADGQKLVDFQNNYTSLIHGHGHIPTVKAVREQIAKGSAYSSPFETQIKLSKLLTERFDGLDLIRFANSGTEANMHALRAARAYTKKAKILKTEGGYHGTTDVFEASVDPNIKKAGTIDKIKVLPESKGVSKNALKDVIVVPFNNIEITRRIIEENHKEIAAFIIEPIMGSAGQIVGSKEYIHFVREITRAYKIVLIFDEVVTGRLSTGGVQKLFQVVPDITTLRKIIGGGTPIGAFGGKREIMEIYDPRKKQMYHSGTFNGNAIGMAAGLATMEDYGQDKVEGLNLLGSRFKQSLLKEIDALSLKIQVFGVGSIFNTIFSDKEITDYRGVAASHENLNELLFMSLLSEGVFMAPRGMFCLSTAKGKDDVDFAVNAIRKSLKKMMPIIKEEAPELIK